MSYIPLLIFIKILATGSNKLIKKLFKSDEQKLILSNTTRSVIPLIISVVGILFLNAQPYLYKVLFIILMELLSFIVRVIKYKAIELDEQGRFSLNGSIAQLKRLPITVFYSINPSVIFKDDMKVLSVSSTGMGIRFRRSIYQCYEKDIVKSLLKVAKINPDIEIVYKYKNLSTDKPSELLVAIAKNTMVDIKRICVDAGKEDSVSKYSELYKDEFLTMAKKLNLSDVDTNSISDVFNEVKEPQ